MFNGIDQLPTASPDRIRLEVQSGAERALRQGHPWVFEQSILKQNREGAPGDLAVIFDAKKRFLGIGLYDPASVIRVKILQTHKPAPINADWFRAKLQTALDRRAPLLAQSTDGFRLVHGENDGLPGMILDRYAQTLVLKLYTAAWLPHLRDVLSALWDLQPAERLVLRLSRSIQRENTYSLHDGMTLYGTPPTEPIIFHENGLTFSADVLKGHKTGFFFDQRENRAAVRELSAGCDVLDMFAYSGGFSVYAAAGGAKSVLSVDISEPALLSAQENFALNQANPGVSACQHRIQAGDAFEIMDDLRQQGRQFDLVIVDSPSFAKSSAEVDRALASYGKLARLATELIVPGGKLVMASCSSRVSAEAFFRAIQQASIRPLKELKQTFHALDHPIGFPEGAYLKCFYGQLK